MNVFINIFAWAIACLFVVVLPVTLIFIFGQLALETLLGISVLVFIFLVPILLWRRRENKKIETLLRELNPSLLYADNFEKAWSLQCGAKSVTLCCKAISLDDDNLSGFVSLSVGVDIFSKSPMPQIGELKNLSRQVPWIVCAIRRKTILDRLLIKIGIRKEIQAIDPEVSELYYCKCKDPIFIKSLTKIPHFKIILNETLRKFDKIEISLSSCTFSKKRSLDFFNAQEITHAAKNLIEFTSNVPQYELLL